VAQLLDRNDDQVAREHQGVGSRHRTSLLSGVGQAFEPDSGPPVRLESLTYSQLFHAWSQIVGAGVQVVVSIPSSRKRSRANWQGRSVAGAEVLADRRATARRSVIQRRQLGPCQASKCSSRGGSVPQESSPSSSRAAVNGTPWAGIPCNRRRSRL